LSELKRIIGVVMRLLFVLLGAAITIGLTGGVGYAGYVVLGPTFAACGFVAVWTAGIMSLAYRRGASARSGYQGDGVPADWISKYGEMTNYVFGDQMPDPDDDLPCDSAISDRRRGA
jgi:hypothetical protein